MTPTELLQEALAYQADEFDAETDSPEALAEKLTDAGVSGADLVEWFAAWRERVRTAVANDSPSLQGHEIQRALVLSTCHLKEATALAADEFSPDDGWCDSLRYGYFAWIGSVPDGPPTHTPTLTPDLPEEVQAAAKLAHSLGCTHLHYDKDGPAYSELPTFDW